MNVILSQIKQLIDFGSYMIFKTASIQTMILLTQKSKLNQEYFFDYRLITENTISEKNMIEILENKKTDSNRILKPCFSRILNASENFVFSDTEIEEILKKIDQKANFRFDKREVIQGIIGSPDKAFLVNKEEFFHFSLKEQSLVKTFYTSTTPYMTTRSKIRSLYIDNELEESVFFNIIKKLTPYKQKMQNQIEKNNVNWPWYRLWRPRQKSFFITGPKVVWAARTMGQNFTYTEDEFYGSRNLFYIKSSRVNLKYIVGLLNSKLMTFYMHERIKHTGAMLQIDGNQFMNIPIFIPDDNGASIAKAIDKILLTLQKNNSISQVKKEIEKIDEEIYRLFNIKPSEQKSINSILVERMPTL